MGDGCRGTAGAVTVGGAMLRAPRTCGLGTTVAQAQVFFADDHVHALLVVDGSRLLSVVERADLVGEGVLERVPAHVLGRLEGRTALPDMDLDVATTLLRRDGRRRLAVVDGAGRLVGLLCAKRSGRGFCSDDDVRARAHERRTLALAG